MPAVFFDESGYTGRNLLDPAQPMFVIASSLIGEYDAARILADAFPRFKGDELKFQDVWKRHRQRLVPLCTSLGERAADLYVWHIDKKFCVLQKMIDYLIEPIAYEAGHDFYKNSYAYKYANYIYFGLTQIGTPELYSATLTAYYEFVCDPTNASLGRLQYRLSLFESSGPAEMKFFFEMAGLGAEHLYRSGTVEGLRGSLEVYVTSMLNCVGFWSQRVDGELDIFHDQSNSFFAQKDLWDALTSKEVAEQLHPVANGPPIKFPLPVGQTNSLDSKTSAAIQLCDLLAGLTAKMRNRPEGEGQDVIDGLLATKIGSVAINGIQPGTEFPDGGPELRDGPDPVDRMVKIIRSGQKKPTAKGGAKHE
jgi:hypothetical protein